MKEIISLNSKKKNLCNLASARHMTKMRELEREREREREREKSR